MATDDTYRVGGLTMHQCGRLLAAVESVDIADDDLRRCIHGRYVRGTEQQLRELASIARKLGVSEWDTTLYGAAERIDGELP